jgi:hypothetical protein
MRNRRKDPALILDAIAYVSAVHRDVTAENTLPPHGVLPRVVSVVLADASLSERAQRWADECARGDAQAASTMRPPWDASYVRVRELLRRADLRNP